jgi:hypothetical protein
MPVKDHVWHQVFLRVMHQILIVKRQGRSQVELQNSSHAQGRGVHEWYLLLEQIQAQIKEAG